MPQESSRTTGKDRYNRLYQTQLESEAEWLRRGAGEKVNSIQWLLERNGIVAETILELGSGTGAVVQECQRRGIGRRFAAVDYSAEAISYLRLHSSGIEARVADITASDFSLAGIFDVVILSHVLEHLEHPSEFLRAISRKINFSHLIIEVPLEDLPALKLKALGKERLANRAGHVQFFNLPSFFDLVRSSDLRIVDQRVFVPISDPDTVRFDCQKNGMSATGYLVKMLTQYYLPKLLTPLWLRWYYAHCAILCESR